MGEPPLPYRTTDFDYDLPAELIAQFPSERRGDSRLLVVGSAARRRGGSAGPELCDLRFADLPSLIPAGDLLVLNSTRVRQARFLGQRPSGAPAEVLLIHPAAGELWVALGKPGSALRPGKRITIGPGAFIETVEVLPDGNRLVRFVGIDAVTALSRYGRLPLPPYITRDPEALDLERYQTVVAQREASVAAPTAGLHFTRDLLKQLESRGVAVETLDLEVGPGTFKPVQGAHLDAHTMHPERYRIPERTAREIAAARRRNGAVWAVGTTVVRALESAAAGNGLVAAGSGETSLFIRPGHRFRVVDRLLTNFHLPGSTLLILVGAFGGTETVLAGYRHAIREKYRFYSYGDAMLVWPAAARAESASAR